MRKSIFFYILGFICVAWLFLPGFSRLQELREKDRGIEDEILQYTVANAELKSRIYKLHNDPVYIEGVIRDKMKKSRKGEIVYKTR